VCGQPAGWRVLADRARLSRPGPRLPLRASVAGLGGHIVAAARLQRVFDVSLKVRFSSPTSVWLVNQACHIWMVIMQLGQPQPAFSNRSTGNSGCRLGFACG